MTRVVGRALFDLDEGCAYCGEEFIGPPLTDEEERWWLAYIGGFTVWCSTGCRDEHAERAGMRALEAAQEGGVGNWRDEAAAAQRLK